MEATYTKLPYGNGFGQTTGSATCATAGWVLLPGLNLELLQQFIASILSAS